MVLSLVDCLTCKSLLCHLTLITRKKCLPLCSVGLCGGRSVTACSFTDDVSVPMWRLGKQTCRGGTCSRRQKYCATCSVQRMWSQFSHEKRSGGNSFGSTSQHGLTGAHWREHLGYDLQYAVVIILLAAFSMARTLPGNKPCSDMPPISQPLWSNNILTGIIPGFLFDNTNAFEC